MTTTTPDNGLIIFINFAGCALAYFLLGVSLWLSTDVPLATKGYWAMGIVLLSVSLINVVKLRFDQRAAAERARDAEEARLARPAPKSVSEAA